MTNVPSNGGVGPTDQVVAVTPARSQSSEDKHGPTPLARVIIAAACAVPLSLICSFITAWLNMPSEFETALTRIRSEIFWSTFWFAIIPCSLVSLLVPEIFMALWYFSLKRLRELRIALRVK